MADMDFDLSGLDQFDLEGLGKRDVPVGDKPNGKPLVVHYSELYPDEDQPRKANNPGFSEESLEEMGVSIIANGIKSPLIVAPKDESGRHKIRDGERRFRGGRRKGVEHFPIIIDDNFDRGAQLLVNLQRADNTADEIVAVIWELENEKGMSRTDIAAKVGKSKAFVTEHAKFGAINPLIRALYENGECRDVTLCNKLDDLFKEFPDQVRSFVTSGRAINRPSVKELDKSLRTPLIEESDNKAPAGVATVQEGQHGLPGMSGSIAGDAGVQPQAPAAPAAAPAPGAAAEDKQDQQDQQEGAGASAPAPTPAPAAAPQAKQETPAAAPQAKQEAPAAAPQAKQDTPAAAPEVYAFGTVNGRAVFLLLDKLAEAGMCWVADEVDGTELLTKCSNFKLERVEAR